MLKNCNYGYIVLLWTIVGILTTLPASAATLDDLQQQINDKSAEIKKLEQEIKTYQSAITTTKQQSATLSGEIKQIDLTRQKLSTDIKVTANNIDAATLRLQKLALQIGDNVGRISGLQAAIKSAIREIRNQEGDGLLAVFASGKDLSSILAETATLDRLQCGLDRNIYELTAATDQLKVNQNDKEKEKANLAQLKVKLTDQKVVADQTKVQKDSLLAVTKNKQSNYEKLLADRLARMKEVQKEVSEIEAQLKTVIKPGSLPSTGIGVLAWPLDKIIITQYFGNTDFAIKHAILYNGQGHNGIDLGAAIGTPIYAAESGTVAGTGDTDKTCQGASYGRWILITHNNGLSTLYAHLSLIKVAAGQTVARGETIAYSGNTGYTTGPHLHFTVYASQGVKIDSLKSKVPGCGTYTMPIASYNSYLNPLSYL